MPVLTHALQTLLPDSAMASNNGVPPRHVDKAEKGGMLLTGAGLAPELYIHTWKYGGRPTPISASTAFCVHHKLAEVLRVKHLCARGLSAGWSSVAGRRSPFAANESEQKDNEQCNFHIDTPKPVPLWPRFEPRYRATCNSEERISVPARPLEVPCRALCGRNRAKQRGV